MNRSEYVESMAIVESACQKSLSKHDHGIWFELLKDIDAADFRSACIVYASEDGTWPNPAKLRKLATEQRHGDSEDFGSVWSRVVYICDHVWCPDRLDDLQERLEKHLKPGDHELIRALDGYAVIYGTPVNQRGTLRAQAKAMYESNQFKTRRMLNLPEPIRKRIETLDRKLIEQVSKKLEVSKCLD